MNRLRNFGLALLAAFAVVAVLASTAAAEPFFFTSAVEHTTLSGAQVGASKITVSGGTVNCANASYSGSIAEVAVSELTMVPAFKECTALGFSNAEVKANSCSLKLTPLVQEGANFEGEADVECEEAGDAITIVAKSAGVTKCTLRIGAQEMKKVTYVEEGSPTALRANLNITGMKYDQIAGTGLGKCTTVEKATNGALESSLLLKGFEGETQVNFGLVLGGTKMKLTPGAINFENKGAGTKKPVEIENKTNANLQIVAIAVPPGFQLTGTCVGVGLPLNGSKCKEEVKCLVVGSKGFLSVRSMPFGMAAAKLENC